MFLDTRHLQHDPRLKDESLKRKFASLWVQKPDYPHDAAVKVIGVHTSYHSALSVYASQVWQEDPFVLAECDRIRDQLGSGGQIPTKEQVALEILELARTGKTHAEKLRGYELFNMTMGYGPKFAGTNQPIVNVHAQKVLVVKDKGDEKSWSEGLVSQQAGIQAEARAEIDGLTKH